MMRWPEATCLAQSRAWGGMPWEEPSQRACVRAPAELSCCSDRSVLPSLLLPERSYARRSPAATLSRVFLLYVFSRRSRNKHSTSLLRPVFAKPAPLHIRCGRKDAALGEPEAEDVEERDAESPRPVDPSRFPKRGPSQPPGTSWCHND